MPRPHPALGRSFGRTMSADEFARKLSLELAQVCNMAEGPDKQDVLRQIQGAQNDFRAGRPIRKVEFPRPANPGWPTPLGNVGRIRLPTD